ncbi:MAG: hypothetical protein AAGI69_09575 [Cyanobacteria bacterium P01_H01_bin.21]
MHSHTHEDAWNGDDVCGDGGSPVGWNVCILWFPIIVLGALGADYKTALVRSHTHISHSMGIICLSEYRPSLQHPAVGALHAMPLRRECHPKKS